MATPKIKIKNLTDADQILLKIGTLKQTLQVIEAKAEEKMLHIKADLAAHGNPLLEDLKLLETALLTYAEENKEILFGDSKTVKLSFGDIAIRISETLEISDETLELCKKYGHLNAIKIEEKLNKNVLKTFTEEQLASIKAGRQQQENFSYKLNEAAILARKSA